MQTGVVARGPGFSFEVPRGWTVTTPHDAVVVRNGVALVSVTRIPLLKRYDPAKFAAVAKELDRVAARLDPKAKGETIEVAGRKIRAYRYADKRIGFVLEGTREYQLFCEHATRACDLLFSSFTLAGQPA